MKKYKLIYRVIAATAAIVFLLSLIVIAASALYMQTETCETVEDLEPAYEPAPLRTNSIEPRKTASVTPMYKVFYAASMEKTTEIKVNYPDETQKLLEEMKTACISGEHEMGADAGERRNQIIQSYGMEETVFTYSDLYLLSKLITAEAGSYWLPQDWRLRVGEVLLNRVASPEFPDTIEDVLYQPNQYYSRSNEYFRNLEPYDYCVDAAVQLLCGERIIGDPSVVFQANFTQGSGVFLCMEDKLLGSTYLCYSSRPELYKGVSE